MGGKADSLAATAPKGWRPSIFLMRLQEVAGLEERLGMPEWGTDGWCWLAGFHLRLLPAVFSSASNGQTDRSQAPFQKIACRRASADV